MIPRTAEEANDLSWLPEPSARPAGFECLIFWRGKWTNVYWSEDHESWSLGYGRGFIVDLDETLYAPMPANTPPAHYAEPKGPYGFYGWKK